ncbi:transporter substrate-binding domain-containing protein [Sansalvadorimonas sp. 2012CJ34-2]|uniref:Transporter substrate-binding domain-containing protein n=1 Tax=Parendozoicomonas callyspongiae TaxID=2942213 RepID=A0ABT0PH95_9GAMM|nr:transporter substrate-binding domain-containing protein [Sansalvadorimonas sp. 2012CJ34-2]MCL6270631.1 transporter substrate-binding domain-containing protein [Sansalvadorimonas sp. 2012CJ34-2]
MKKFFIALLASLSLIGSAFAADNNILDKIIERGVIRIGFDTGYQPFEMVNKKGDYIGFDVDLAKQMAKAMGVKVEFVNTAWDGIIPALLTDKFDIIMAGMTVTPQRNLRVNFADPYIVIGQTVVLRKELAGKIKKPRDLNDAKYKLAVKLGTTGHEAAKRYFPKAEIFEFETQDDAKLEVLNGKLDAFVYDLPYNSIFASQNADRVAFLSEPFTYEPLAWAVRRGDEDFINWLNNFLRQVKGDGTYDRLYAKWFESDRWLSTLK